MSIEIRPCGLEGVQTLLSWAELEGWNPGLADAAPFFAADPQGFIGGFVDGAMIAGISAVATGPDFGFIGLYICHPDFRGRGYGRLVWDAGIAYLGNRAIGLDGVPAQQRNYRRMGFIPAYRTWRYSGRVVSSRVARFISPVSSESAGVVAAFDRRFYPGPRVDFLKHWLAPPRIARAIIRNGRVDGYGVLRKCRDGYKIGPLFATSADDAKEIFLALCAETNGDSISLDVPESSAAFGRSLTRRGFDKSFDTMRMYRGRACEIDMRGIFGVTTLELG